MKFVSVRFPSWIFYVFTFIGGGFLGFVFIVIYGYYSSSFGKKFLTPLGMYPQILSIKVPSQKPVMGFLPYWTVNDADIKYHLIDYLVYFGVGLNPDGTIKQKDGDNTELGWYRLQGKRVKEIFALAKKQDVKIAVAVTALSNEAIDGIVSNPDHKRQAIDSIITIAKTFDLDGVNIDFEYNNGDKINGTPEAFVQFLKELKERVVKENLELEISVDLYANAFIQNKPYDVAALQNHVDQLILMGYDFHRAASANTGPVAPLKSDDNISITDALQAAINKKIDSKKIVLAMPLYGYEWRTTTRELNASTYPGTGMMASYKRISALIEEQKLEPNWHGDAMSPWIVYDVGNTIHQVYYENDQSLGYKFQLIDQANLGGGAFRALGYEGENASPWTMVEDWRRKN